jgi:hypothetical protein
MRALFLAGAAAIGLLAAGSLLAIWLGTGPGEPAPDLPGPPAPAAAPPTLAAGAAAAPAAPHGEPEPGPASRADPPPASAARPAPGPPHQPAIFAQRPAPREEWEKVPPMPRGLPALLSGIARDQPRLRACFEPGVQQRFAGQAYSSTRRQQVDDHGSPVLMLELLALPDGRLRIEDAPVEKRGVAGPGLLACAQEALRGVTVSVPGSEPGARLRVRYPLR